MRVVLDTNVLVSALINPHVAPASIAAYALTDHLVPLFDERILAEYREVLARPRFGFDPHAVATFIEALEASGLVIVAAPTSLVLPDADDLPFAEVAIAGAAQALVTGNLRHFVGVTGIAIYTPSEFLGKMRRTSGD